MTKIIRNLTLKLRGVSQNSFGVTIPLDIVDKYSLKDGDLIQIPEMLVESDITEYECGVCGLFFTLADWEDKVCPGCEDKYIIFKDSILKGGVENGR